MLFSGWSTGGDDSDEASKGEVTDGDEVVPCSSTESEDGKSTIGILPKKSFFKYSLCCFTGKSNKHRKKDTKIIKISL